MAPTSVSFPLATDKSCFQLGIELHRQAFQVGGLMKLEFWILSMFMALVLAAGIARAAEKSSKTSGLERQAGHIFRRGN